MKARTMQLINRIENKAKNESLIFAYRVIEYIDGEKWLKIISYRLGEKVKLMILQNITEGD